jgi:hypothetical protein
LIAGITGWDPPPKVHILTSGHRYQVEARNLCLIMLADLARRTGANLVVIERDDSRYESDRRTLTRYLTEREHPVRWEILRAKDDPMLWSADAMAWCWTNPDHIWRRRIAPLIRPMTKAPGSAKPGTPTVRKATGLTSQDSCPSQHKDTTPDNATQ